jgi:hypothetical protein
MSGPPLDQHTDIPVPLAERRSRSAKTASMGTRWALQPVQIAIDRIFGQSLKIDLQNSARAVERIQFGMANSLAG